MPKDIIYLSSLDRKILSHLQEDASCPMAQIAQEVGSSTSACWRRVRLLQENGVIEKQTMIINRRRIGLGFAVIASVKLVVPSQEKLDHFERRVMDWPEVLECFTVSGATDYVLRVVTTDIEAYDQFLRSKLLSLGTVADVQSRIVVTDIKTTTSLPIDLAPEAP